MTIDSLARTVRARRPARPRDHLRRIFGGLALGATLLGASAICRPARADVVPAPVSLPDPLSLDEAVATFKKRGLDLLIADANVRNAEGVVKAAGASPNPTLSISGGNALSYSKTSESAANCLANGAVCTPWVFSVGISDSAALFDYLTGAKGARVRVALNNLAASKLTRADTERNLIFALKSAYANVVSSALSVKLAKEIADSNVVTLKKFRARYKLGLINEGDLRRIETQKLESDQAYDTAVAQLRQARVGLAFLLGVRGAVPDFKVDERALDFRVPPKLDHTSEKQLASLAFERRPDLLALSYQIDAASAQIDLIRRQKIPQVALGVSYSWGGFGGYSTNGPVGPQSLTFSLSVPLPAFYQLDGEMRQAKASYDAAALTRAKVSAQVINDISTGLAAFVGARKLVERMEGPIRDEGGLLESAIGALNSTALQYDKGLANLTDYLDALRSYIATKNEYIGDLNNYWTAVYQVEQAVGVELR
jgi:cobalt-zinc-cadmium efflux system outer membrane protein